MKTITINEFYGGMADDRFGNKPGGFAFAKHFDVLTHPHRLQPLRGMTTHTASTGIGNLITASNGLMYGVGIDGSNPNNGKLWKLAGYGATDDFVALATNQLSGATVSYDLLVDYPDAGNSRTIFWASTNLIVASDPAGGSSASTQALTFTSMGQGLVHPKDKVLYIPYRTASASYIATIGANATPFSTYSATAFTLPSQYRCYCLTYYGNYLAIPATSVSAGSNLNSNIVYLSDRDTSQSTFAESIPWGDGFLKVLNNLDGALIGVSELGSDTIQAGTSQDYNAILVKVYDGGSEPRLVGEIKAQHLAASLQASVVLNPRVNFIHNNRLYFSASVNPNDAVQTAWYGLWSVGRNKVTGEYTIVDERAATSDNSETGVIAAAIAGDYVETVHTAAGTLTKSTNGQTSSTTYNGTSIYESLVNPNMPVADRFEKKKLYSVTVHYLPLPSGASVTLKYRTDSQGGSTDWLTCGSNASSETDTMERTRATAAYFTDGRNFEFRVESTGGAVITGITYRYDTIATNQ